MYLPIKNFTALAVAVQVAERGSFAKASKALGLSTSAVSKSIGRLEEQLGIKLFNRTTRSVSLTADGQLYIDKLKPLLVQINGLTQNLIDDSSNPKGLLRVGAPISFGRIILAEIVAEFSVLYPDVQIELVLDDRTTDLTKEQIDVSIRTGNLGDSANMVARRFMLDSVVVCASRDYINCYGAPKRIGELEEHRRITFRNNRTGRPESWLFKGGVRVGGAGIVQSNTTDSVIEMVLAGAGLGQVSYYKVKEQLDSGELVEVMQEQRPPAMKYSVLYMNRKLLAPRIRLFIDFLLQRLGN